MCKPCLRRAVPSFSCPGVLLRICGASPSKCHLSLSCSHPAAPPDAAWLFGRRFSDRSSLSSEDQSLWKYPGLVLFNFISIFFLFCLLAFFWTKIHPPVFHLSGTGTNECSVLTEPSPPALTPGRVWWDEEESQPQLPRAPGCS